MLYHQLLYSSRNGWIQNGYLGTMTYIEHDFNVNYFPTLYELQNAKCLYSSLHHLKCQHYSGIQLTLFFLCNTYKRTSLKGELKTAYVRGYIISWALLVQELQFLFFLCLHFLVSFKCQKKRADNLKKEMSTIALLFKAKYSYDGRYIDIFIFLLSWREIKERVHRKRYLGFSIYRPYFLAYFYGQFYSTISYKLISLPIIDKECLLLCHQLPLLNRRITAINSQKNKQAYVH